MTTSAATREGLTVVVPVYNEEQAVAAGVTELRDVLAADGRPHEIIVVDDGSSDGTAAALVAADLGPAIRLLCHPVNRGYGAAIQTGIQAARHDLIAITDADGTYPANRLPELTDAMADGYDMVVGARTGPSVQIPLLRRPVKWALGVLANYLAGVQIPDLNSGLRVMRRQALERFRHILPAGYSFTTTITLALLTNHHAVRYISVDYAARVGRSKFHPIRDTWNMGLLILRTVMYFKPLKVFFPLALLVALAGIGVFTWSYLAPGVAAMDTTLAITLMTAVQLAALGLLADLIDKRTVR